MRWAGFRSTDPAGMHAEKTETSVVTSSSRATFPIMRTSVFLLLCMLTHLRADDQTSKAVRDHWFNGAEICRYDLVQSRYGEEHPGHAEFIFVTEPFLTGEQVKHERGPGPSVPVLKLNALRTFNTGIYSYRTMTSTFQPTDIVSHSHALKTNTSVQDWCGQVFQQINRRPDGWSLQLFSYFQKEGDLTEKLGEAFLEDAVWLRMRLDPSSLPQGNVTLIPGALFSRFQHVAVAPESATASLVEKGGLYQYTVFYPKLGRTLEILADKGFPHIIREWSERQEGTAAVTRARLTHRLENQAYWEHNKRVDADSRKGLGLAPEPK